MTMQTNILNRHIQDTLAKKNLLLIKLYKNYPTAQKIKQLEKIAFLHNVPLEIVLGVYMIEVTFRPFWFRWLENIVLNIRMLMSIIFHVSIPNYTIGKFQIGLGTIFSFAKYSNNIHTRYIKPISIKQGLLLLKSQFWPTNMIIAVWWLSKLYTECEHLDYTRRIRYIGVKYNGSVSYGSLLESLVSKIRQRLNNT